MQTRLESAVERMLDIGSGFIIAMLVYEWVILPNEDIRTDAFTVTLIFTTISLVRGYVWRRYFNKRTVDKQVS